MDSMYTYSEVAVENDINGRRSYVEVVAYANGTVHLGTEDDGPFSVEITMTPGEALALIEHLNEALRTVAA